MACFKRIYIYIYNYRSKVSLPSCLFLTGCNFIMKLRINGSVMILFSTVIAYSIEYYVHTYICIYSRILLSDEINFQGISRNIKAK